MNRNDGSKLGRWIGRVKKLALMVCLAGLPVACGGQAPMTPTPAPATVPTAETAAATPEPAGEIALTYWEEDSDDGALLLDALVASFMETNPGITVTRVHQGYDDLRNQFRAESFAGEAPDLVRAPGEFAGPFGELEIVAPVESLYSNAFLDQFYPGALAGVKVGGKLWGLPDNYGNHLMLIYNKALVTSTPGDSERWLAQLKSLSDPPNGKWGLAFPTSEAYWLIPFLSGFGGWPLDAQDQPTLDTPEMTEALWYVRDLVTKHQVVPPDATYEMAFDLFRQGKAAYVIDGAWNLPQYQGLGVDLGVAQLPRITESGLEPVPMSRGRYWFINAALAGSRLEAAARLAEYMTAPETQKQWYVQLGRLPSNREVAQEPEISADLLAGPSMAQLALARAVPPALEMACAWQGIGAHLPAVTKGTLSPDDASAAMQRTAQACVDEMSAE